MNALIWWKANRPGTFPDSRKGCIPSRHPIYCIRPCYTGWAYKSVCVVFAGGGLPSTERQPCPVTHFT